MAKRVWQARLDPRRQTPSIVIYSHVRDRWGIFHAQPLVLNDQRQAGAAIEGVIRHEELDIAQLAVDTHGHTDFAMALARLLGFDLCPRLKALKDRHLFVPGGTAIPDSVRAICRATVDLDRIREHWDETVHLVASVHCGYTSAVHVTARYGSAARGDPLFEALSHLGRLLRTVFLCDYSSTTRSAGRSCACSIAARPSTPSSVRSIPAAWRATRPSAPRRCKRSPTP